MSQRVSNNRLKKQDSKADDFTWRPHGLSPEQVEEFFGDLPSKWVPRTDSDGALYREDQLKFQNPAQDWAPERCSWLEPDRVPEFKTFVTARDRIAADVGVVLPVASLHSKAECSRCQKPHSRGLVVISPRLGPSLTWHPACFTCLVCREWLVDLRHCVLDGNVLCARHYAEHFHPRCAQCQELIYSGEYTKAMDQDWHTAHFSCWQCDESLSGQRYVLRDDHPYCVRCYLAAFGNNCIACNQVIGIDSKDLSYKENHWHESCFNCYKCSAPLLEKPFGCKGDKVYCGPCYESAFAARCDGCQEPFKPGSKKLEYKGHQWHEKCFVCCTCKQTIGTKSFIPRENSIYCLTCYEETFATRCVKCNKTITQGGVTYRGDPWHRECFTCTQCQRTLAGQRFTSREDRPYCADCFGELFAKRCAACSRAITGIGGTRFISFEERYWHNDCFVCAACNNSLVGRGFIADGADILCPECAKQRLL